MKHADVVVIGAGPAGLGSALALAGHGAKVVVVDERSRPGGQIYRQLPSTFVGDGLPRGRAYAAGRQLLAAAEEADGIEWRTGTLAWGLFEPQDAGLDPSDGAATWVLALADTDRVDRLAAQHVLVAAGAYDLPVAFPGWTLPGVMTAGGVQAFVKGEKLVPGRRFVLAGAHPLLLVVADQLLEAGAEVAGVVFAQPRPRVSDAAVVAARLHGRIGPVLDVAGAAVRLARRRVPVLFSHLIAEAEGVEHVEAVAVRPVDGEWRFSDGSGTRFECDTLAIGYGFVPSSELPRQAGCSHRWVPAAGGWVVEHDDWMRSSRRGISVAGETTGIAGGDQAAEEGRLAGIGILRDLGLVSDGEAERRARPVRRRLVPLRRFAALAQERFAPNYDALSGLADAGTIVCRCEEVTAGSLRAALAEHPDLGDADAAKLLTRVGMGPCQGRFCMLTVASIVAEASGRSRAEVGAFTARPPAKPIPVAQLAAAAAEQGLG
jgi:D-hydroxyproline dehydrogenase subunit alpha